MGKNDNGLADLSSGVIESALQRSINGAVRVTVLDRVESTNTWLKDNIAQSADCDLSVCATEQQTDGRGRRGKTWHSPRGGVTFSVGFAVAHPMQELAGIALICGAALCDVLRTHGLANALVKWPNDVLVEQAKLSGILVEVINARSEQCTVIVGIGVNYRHGAESSRIDQSSTDLYEALGDQRPDRSLLIGEVVAAVFNACQGSITESVRQLSLQWAKYDALAGMQVEIDSNGEILCGTATGIDDIGRLRVKTADGEVAVLTGSVSVKRL